jgi:predicted nucleic acid-binding protein
VTFCVLDASCAFPWIFADETSAEADALLERIGQSGALVPGLWHIEIANGVGMAERRGRLTLAQARQAIDLLSALPLEVDDAAPSRALGPVLDLMRAHGLTAYDAVYLDLALRRSLPLATRDKALQAAARRAGLGVAGIATI